ncbi:hypothetical protein Q3G72_033788 [Acer saccharum]|nr:hypothetical protein Q3G72_033788 [Acer saccharum]
MHPGLGHAFDAAHPKAKHELSGTTTLPKHGCFGVSGALRPSLLPAKLDHVCLRITCPRKLRTVSADGLARLGPATASGDVHDIIEANPPPCEQRGILHHGAISARRIVNLYGLAHLCWSQYPICRPCCLSPTDEALPKAPLPSAWCVSAGAMCRADAKAPAECSSSKLS